MVPSSALLNYPNGLRVLGIDVDPLDITTPIHVLIATTAARTRCPYCGRYSSRVHSRYQRTLRDLPCAGRAIVANMRVRRFRWTSPKCTIKLFCERLGGFAASCARRTRRMNQSLTALARAEGGRPSSRLAQMLGLRADRMTLLRLVRPAPEFEASTPTALGVDDKPHCFKRGAGKFSPRQVASLLLLPTRTPQQQALLDRQRAGDAEAAGHSFRHHVCGDLRVFEGRPARRRFAGRPFSKPGSPPRSAGPATDS